MCQICLKMISKMPPSCGFIVVVWHEVIISIYYENCFLKFVGWVKRDMEFVRAVFRILCCKKNLSVKFQPTVGFFFSKFLGLGRQLWKKKFCEIFQNSNSTEQTFASLVFCFF